MRNRSRFILPILGALCGFALVNYFSARPDFGAQSPVRLAGDAVLRDERLVLTRGSSLTVDLSGASGADSVIVSFHVRFADLNNFAVVATGPAGAESLIDADIGLRDMLKKREGLVEIGFEEGEALVQFNSVTQRRIEYDLKNLRGLVVEARTSEAHLDGLSAVARSWSGLSPVDTRVIADMDFARSGPRPAWRWIGAVLGALVVLAACRMEREILLALVRIAPEALLKSQIASWAFLGGGLLISEKFLFLHGAQSLILWLFAYWRLRFIIIESGQGALADSRREGLVALFLGVVALAFATNGMLSRIGLPGRASLIFSAIISLVPFPIAFLYSRLAGVSFRRAASAVGWCSLPALLTFFNPIFLPLAALALGRPAWASRKTMRGAGPLILACALLAFPAAELAARSSLPPQATQAANVTPDYQPDDLLFYVPRNFFAFTKDYLKRDDFKVQALKLRGNVVPLKKNPDVFRILVMGGSNVWGDGIADESDTFCARLQDKLNADLPSRRFEVLNGGIRGYNSFQIMLFFTRWAWRFEPDLVLLYMNRNDSVSMRGLFRLRDLLKDDERAARVSRARRILSQSALYNLATRRYAGARHDFRTISFVERMTLQEVNPPEDVKENMRDILRKAREIGAKAALVSEFWGEDVKARNSDIIVPRVREATALLAREEGVPYFDALDAFPKNYRVEDVVFAHDTVHLNAYGHAALADMLFDFLVRENLLVHH